MDRGPVIFTSVVSLPKDDKSDSEVNKSQLGNSQDYEGTAMLTMLQRKEGLKSNGQYAKVSRPKSICIYYESSTLRYLSRTSRWYYVVNPTDEGVIPRLLTMGLPGVPEDKRPTELSHGSPWPASWHRHRSPRLARKVQEACRTEQVRVRKEYM